jgi:predicted dehydrogenase
MGGNHARIVAQSERAELVAVVDPFPENGKRLAEKFDTKWLPELPDLSDVDAVIVAAATEAHYDTARQVLESDTALLLEKPVAASLALSEEIVALADARDVALVCGLLERYNPAILTARTLIEDPFHVTATRHSPYAARIKTGVAWDLLVHDVDLAILLNGAEPSEVAASRGFVHPESDGDAEDIAETVLRFESGAIAHVSASRVGQRKIRQVSVYEHSRLVEIDLLRRDVTVYHHVSESADDGRGYRQQTIIEIPELVTSVEPLTAQFAAFLDIIDGLRDAASERATILPAHRVIDRVIAA